MVDTEIERENIEINGEGTMSSASTGIRALLPLVAASSLGTTTVSLDLHNYGAEKLEASVEVNVEARPSSELQISQGANITKNSLDNINLAFDKEIDYEFSNLEEFEILENFINDILNNSQQQPGNLKSLMYDNIDDLLI